MASAMATLNEAGISIENILYELSSDRGYTMVENNTALLKEFSG